MLGSTARTSVSSYRLFPHRLNADFTDAAVVHLDDGEEAAFGTAQIKCQRSGIKEQ